MNRHVKKVKRSKFCTNNAFVIKNKPQTPAGPQVEETTELIQDKIQKLMYIYSLAWDELSKQVSTEWLERGIIMSKILASYNEIFNKVSDDFFKKSDEYK